MASNLRIDAKHAAGGSLAIYMPDLSGGGLERLQLELAPFFVAAGIALTFVLATVKGKLVSEIPADVRVHSLDANRQLKAFWPLVRYLRHARPDVLLVHTEHSAIISLWARALSRAQTRVIVCQHNTVSLQIQRSGWKFRILLTLFRLFLGWADQIVAVSAGVADDLAASCGIARERITVIYNGVVGSDFLQKYNAPVAHRWFADSIPVIVAAGRMVDQKDFATLISAFAIVAKHRDTRLILLGEGPLRPSLEALAAALRVTERIDMPGFCNNPMPFLRRAALVVLSSRFEGFGMVLAEALACGTPVVSTDCPHGPAEILEDGRYGRLVPVGDPEKMAEAIIASLDVLPDRDALKGRGNDFTVQSAAASYLDLIRDTGADTKNSLRTETS
jgi:glycosyltransferase involved in cell wall biosynthesis